MLLGKFKLLFVYCIQYSIFQYSIAQSTSYSPYSIYGIGDEETIAFSPNIAMGNAKYSLAMPYSVNISNPASYGFLHYPTFDAGFTSSFQRFSYGDSAKKANTTYFKNMAFAFPVSKRWWASSFGIVPYTRMGYNITDSDTITDFGVVNYSYKGSGGISRFFFGNTFNLLKDSIQQFSIGANVSYLFGSAIKTRRVMPSVSAFNLKIVNETFVSDFCYDAGFIYSRKFGNKINVSLGADYEFEKKLKAQNIVFAETYTGTEFSEVPKDTVVFDTLSGVISVPQKIGTGVSFYYKNKWLVSAEYSFQDWAQYSYFGKITGLAKHEQISFGIQYNFNEKETRNLLKAMNYRAGFRTSNTRLVVKSQQLKEFGITFGVGIPIGIKSNSSFNLSAETGIRGENKNGLVGEQFTNIIFGFSFTPSYYDRWFVKPKID